MLREAQLWYCKLQQEESDMEWKTFMECCTLRFGPPLQSNSLGKLVNIKQTASIEEYQRQFQRLLARASTIRRDQQIKLFTARLIESLV